MFFPIEQTSSAGMFRMRRGVFHSLSPLVHIFCSSLWFVSFVLLLGLFLWFVSLSVVLFYIRLPPLPRRNPFRLPRPLLCLPLIFFFVSLFYYSSSSSYSSLSNILPLRPLPRLRRNPFRLPRNLSPKQPDPLEPRRILLPPFPHRHTSEQRLSWRT